MKRLAILIDCGNAINKSKLGGTSIDVINLRKWLNENHGGAWDSDEIVIMNNPTTEQLISQKAKTVLYDYCFFAFSGHGGISENPLDGIRTQFVVASDGKTVNLKDIQPMSSKATIIYDSCRYVEKEPIMMSSAATINRKTASDNELRIKYKYFFNAQIQHANPGRYTMFGCSINEGCGDDPLNGGLFTSSLLSCAKTWMQTNKIYLNTSNAFELARIRTRESALADNRNQNPVGTSSDRRGNDFPFAINLQEIF